MFSTPIGNLDDITLRALKILKSVDAIACEDTRHTRILLDHHGIKSSLISYHQQSGPVKTDRIMQMLIDGRDIALVSDAGTPSVSDPGQKLISAAIKSKITITVIPGPSACTSAFSLSGFTGDGFVFLGFLPQQEG